MSGDRARTRSRAVRKGWLLGRRAAAAGVRRAIALARQVPGAARSAWGRGRMGAARLLRAPTTRAALAGGRTALAAGIGFCFHFWAGLKSCLRVVATTIALVLLALGPVFLLSKRVHAGMIGVQQSQWGGGGVVQRDFAPGLWRSLRGWHTWHFLDGRTHFLEFGYDSDGAEHRILDLRTRDGNVVKVSVTVPYRIRPGEAHLLVAGGLKGAYPDMVRSTARNLISQELAELTSADLADTDLRRQRMDAALPRLNEALRPFHVVAETIQVHQVFFWMSYEDKLQAKQLTRQNALLAEAVTLVEEEKRSDWIAEEIVAEEQRIRAEMNKLIEQKKAEAFRRIAEIKREAQTENVLRRAEADAIYKREVATGELALERAEALRDELTQAALETEGGRILLAREAAQKLNIKTVMLDSSDPSVPSVLDLDEMVRLLVGERE